MISIRQRKAALQGGGGFGRPAMLRTARPTWAAPARSAAGGIPKRYFLFRSTVSGIFRCPAAVESQRNHSASDFRKQDFRRSPADSFRCPRLFPAATCPAETPRFSGRSPAHCRTTETGTAAASSKWFRSSRSTIPACQPVHAAPVLCAQRKYSPRPTFRSSGSKEGQTEEETASSHSVDPSVIYRTGHTGGRSWPSADP